MNNAVKHRGPDGEGIYVDGLVSLGHRRLAILDLSDKGKQPMSYEHNGRKVVITYNGEIYNFEELRATLEHDGYKFRSETDTEVILAAYLRYDMDCVTHFNGMWAFCIYDSDKKILFCSRDRLGKKPFYYYGADGLFIFSSELKGILEHRYLGLNALENVNEDAIDFYFSLGFIPAPYSIYENAYKLEARQNLIYDLKRKKIARKMYYYEIPGYRPICDKQKLIEEGRSILKDAVRLRMRSDVPVGAFLSGGLDSSTVVGVMKDFTELKKLHTFSIGFEGKYDETPYVNIVKNHFETRHHHYYFGEKDFENMLDTTYYYYDEPFGDYSNFPTYEVSKLAKRYVTVVLTGDGGDEIFGGYTKYVTAYRMDLLYRIPRFLRRLGSMVPTKENQDHRASLYLLKEALKVSLSDKKSFYADLLEDERPKPKIYKTWTTEKLDYCLRKGQHKLAEALRTCDLLFVTLPDYFLAKVDRASMANGLEIRSPFLDYRFVEFAQKIPTELKIDLFETKKLMREIIRDILPEEIVRRGKQGFTPPLEKWILDRKYDSFFESPLNILGKMNRRLFEFFKGKVLRKSNGPYTNDKIRLFLFGRWWEKWIKE
jgi:asparagine synthase (glutamine-hydrolysing)